MRNIAAMVPPALVPPDNERHGTSAGIEYAVRGLQVEHVVILGHALCGGIAALVDGDQSAVAHYDYVSTWTAIGRNMRDVAVHDLADRSRDEILRLRRRTAAAASAINSRGQGLKTNAAITAAVTAEALSVSQRSSVTGGGATVVPAAAGPGAASDQRPR